jgi:glycosyltransferase involved in cell wall biosynthesis
MRRVCFLLSTRGFAYGGLETVADQLAAGLARRGYGVSFVAGGRTRGDLPPLGHTLRVPVLAHTSPAARVIARVLRVPPLHVQSAAFVAACLADPKARRALLSCDLCVTFLEGESALVSRLLKRRSVAYLAGALDLRWARADRSWLRVATSQTTADLYARHGLRCDGVVTPGISRDLLTGPPAASPGGTRLIYVGRLEPNKRVDWLLDVVQALPVPSLSLHVIGDGPLRPQLEAAVARRHLPVTFHSSLPPNQVATQLRQADVFVFPSAYESFGTAALEGLAVGLPVVASDLPALREATGGHADLLAPDDLAGWVEVIQRLLADPSGRAARAEAGRAWAAGFTWDQVVDRFETLLGSARPAGS